MNFSEEWKREWPVSTAFRHPLLKSRSSVNSIGPLCFTSSTEPPTLVITSPSLSPKFSPPPHLSFVKFLTKSSIFPSTSSDIASSFGSQSPAISSLFLHNRLHLLRCEEDVLAAFFPTGDNLQRIGYVTLKLQASSNTNRLGPILGKNGGIFIVEEGSISTCSQIIRIAVNQLDSNGESHGLAGYLMVSTMYSVRWFSVSSRSHVSDSVPLAVASLGKKCFKSCAVVHSSWSPHMCNESIVLLENGDLFLFDIHSEGSHGLRLKVPWSRLVDSPEFSWLGCDFSWHPRIIIVYGSDAVFLVDFRVLSCSVRCIASVDMPGITVDSAEKDRFRAFSRVLHDSFCFAVVSKHWLVIYDIRKPLIPILRWAHNLEYPCYISSFSLSDFRAQAKREEYTQASRSGFCFILGSFWTSEFSVFCYGIPFSESLSGSEMVKYSGNPFSAWGLPSGFSLSGRECACGNCLIRESFYRDGLPGWVHWQNKKEIAIGFAVLDADLLPLLYKPTDFGGFALIRLLSSGKLEVQQYVASWECSNKCKKTTTMESPLSADCHLIYSFAEDKYKFTKRFVYIDLDYLEAYLNGDLFTVLASKIACMDHLVSLQTETIQVDKLMEDMLISFGCVLGSSSPISVIFEDLSLPTSVYEMVSRRLWAGLPLPLLRRAFTPCEDASRRHHSDPKRSFFELLPVPGAPQLPPFFLRNPSHLSNKWHRKVRSSVVATGPAYPLPVLLGLRDLYEQDSSRLEMDKLSQSGVVSPQQCEEVMMMARDMATTNLSTEEQDSELVVSLMEDDDQGDPWNSSQRSKPLLLYGQTPLSDPVLVDHSFSVDDAYSTFVARLSGKPHSYHTKLDSSEAMSSVKGPLDMSSVDLMFDVAAGSTQVEMSSMNFLTKQYSKWLEEFNSNT